MIQNPIKSVFIKLVTILFFFMVTEAEQSSVTMFGAANAELLFQAHPESKSYDPQTGLFLLPDKVKSPQAELRKNFFFQHKELQKLLKTREKELELISAKIQTLQTIDNKNPAEIANQLYRLVEKQFSRRCSFLQNFLHLYQESQNATAKLLLGSHLPHKESVQKIKKIWLDIELACTEKMTELQVPAIFNSAVSGHLTKRAYDTHLLFVKNLPEDHFFATLCANENLLQQSELTQILSLFLQKEDFITPVISTGTIDITTEIISLIQRKKTSSKPQKKTTENQKTMLHSLFLLHPEMLKFDWNYHRFISGNRYFFFQPGSFKNIRQLMRGIGFSPDTYQTLEKLTILELNNTEKEALNSEKIPLIQQQIQATVSEWQHKKALPLLFQENILLPEQIANDLQKRLILAPVFLHDNSIDLLANFYKGVSKQQKLSSEKLLSAFKQLINKESEK